MTAPNVLGKGARALLAGACAVIVVLFLQMASTVVVPVLAAAFLAVVSLPALAWLRSLGLPRWMAVAILLLTVFALLSVLTAVVTHNVTVLASNLPAYREILDAKAADFNAWLAERKVPVDVTTLLSDARPGDVLGYATGVLTAAASLARDSLFVLLAYAFLLMEAAVLPGKIRQITGRVDDDLGRFEGVLGDVQGYLKVKLGTNLLTGVLVSLSCVALNTPYAVLIGVVAFFLNFIPAIGPIIASVPAVLLCLAMNGWWMAVGMVVAQLVINVSIGSGLEPMLFGRRLGLSAAVVFLSLVFWGWVLGPIGMLLSVPLTMIVRILLDNSEDLHWLAVLLGPGVTGGAKPRQAAHARD